MLRYLADHRDTYAALVTRVLDDPTVSFQIFAAVAGATFRGTAGPDYGKLIERTQRILNEEDDSQREHG